MKKIRVFFDKEGGEEIKNNEIRYVPLWKWILETNK